MEKISLAQAVIVEGRYDKIKLEAVVDAFILPTNGFRVFSDLELRALIRRLAETRGIIVLTDSDAAGFKIRGFLRGIVPPEQVTDVYIPDLYGKERRKQKPSREGKLGVEGMNPAILLEAFRKAGISAGRRRPARDPITRFDLYEDGVSGGEGSREKRRLLYRKLGLPERLSPSAALELLNQMLTREEYRQAVEELGQCGGGEM
jgi:ribonuclease M5